jgi:hypothetical protein
MSMAAIGKCAAHPGHAQLGGIGAVGANSQLFGPDYQAARPKAGIDPAGTSEKEVSTMVKFKSIVAVAAVAIALAFQPGAASAQITGLGGGNVGGDGYTRAMWHGTDGSVSLWWKLDSNLNVVGTHNYGPYTGWSPVSIATNVGNETFVLWRYTDGTAQIWALDNNLNYWYSKSFGPVAGWTPEWLGITQSGFTVLLWKSTTGAISAWQIAPGTLTPVGSVQFGPYWGWNF